MPETMPKHAFDDDPLGAVFDPGGILAASLPGHEARPDQLNMARAVAKCLDVSVSEPEQPLESGADGEQRAADCLLVEAETGLGKTLAYLVPALLCQRKVVVSTATRNLQDQILEREIPFLRRHIAPDLRAIRIKGRQNYICLSRYQQLKAGKKSDILDKHDAGLIDEWLADTVWGDRSELDWLPSASPLWQRICSLSDACLGTDCPHARDCFINHLRREAAQARLLIINHHLLFSDLAVRRGGHGEVLPRYEAVILDEAHHVERVATSFFGISFSQYQCLDLIADLERAVEATETQNTWHTALVQAARSLHAHLDHFLARFPAKQGRFPLAGILNERPELLASRDELLAGLGRFAARLDESKEEQPWSSLRLRADDLAGRLKRITAELFDDLLPEEIRFIHWYEQRRRTLSLHASPIDVASELEATLFREVESCVFTSATLTTGKDFAYYRQRLGLADDTPAIAFASPFDYSSRALTYVVEDGFPEPASRGYTEAALQRMEQLLHISSGRALLLFTSYQAMRAAADYLADKISFPLLMQGEAPRHALLARFAAEIDSVLLAVASFWEGVDVPGESLSMVIIDKLPFEVPSDPVIMARIERIKAEGGNPFFDFQVPRAILSLRQGVGRLMRRADDRGVIALLDVRLFSKGYGRSFRRGLPAAPVTREMEEVENFFQEEKR